MLRDIYLAGGCRTPIGSFCGALSSVTPVELGATVVRSALGRTSIRADQVDQVIFGNVISAGLGQNIARQIALGAGLPASVGASTINKVCGSGLAAVAVASQMIQCGDAEVVIAGGVESMSRAPYLLRQAREGYRMGDGELVDAMIYDGLWDVYNNVHMGTCGDECARRYALSRQDQDDFAVESYRRALRATEDGTFAREVVPVQIHGRKGAVTTVTVDEEPQRFDEQKLRGLRPAFNQDGTVTAGNASSINDGAAAVVVLSRDRAEQLGVTPQARVLGYCTYSREPEWFTLAPIGALTALMQKLDMSADEVDLFEINEAFSSVVLAAMLEHKLGRDKVNVFGGAVALGHPIGASGTRTLVTLLNAMAARRARLGIDALCIGGGEAIALAAERTA